MDFQRSQTAYARDPTTAKEDERMTDRNEAWKKLWKKWHDAIGRNFVAEGIDVCGNPEVNEYILDLMTPLTQNGFSIRVYDMRLERRDWKPITRFKGMKIYLLKPEDIWPRAQYIMPTE